MFPLAANSCYRVRIRRFSVKKETWGLLKRIQSGLGSALRKTAGSLNQGLKLLRESIALKGASMKLGLILGLSLFVGAASVAKAEPGQPLGWSLESASSVRYIDDVALRYDPKLSDEAEILAAAIPSWWSQLEIQLGRKIPNKLTIHFVNHSGRVAQATGMPHWVAGVAQLPRGEIAIAYHGPDGSPSNLEDLLRHELAHIALYRATNRAKMPRWFHEGVADGLSDEIDLRRAETLAAAIFGRGVPPTQDWDPMFRSKDQDVSLIYAASRDFVNHLRYRQASEEEFRQLIERLSQGEEFEHALSSSFGLSQSELEQRWRDGLMTRMIWFPLMGSGTLPILFAVPVMALAWARRRKFILQGLARLEAEDRVEFLAYGSSAWMPNARTSSAG